MHYNNNMSFNFRWQIQSILLLFSSSSKFVFESNSVLNFWPNEICTHKNIHENKNSLGLVSLFQPFIRLPMNIVVDTRFHYTKVMHLPKLRVVTLIYTNGNVCKRIDDYFFFSTEQSVFVVVFYFSFSRYEWNIQRNEDV